jgi:hypothetical protein
MAKLTFLFWNIAKKDLRPQIENLVVLHEVDVLILAESGLTDRDILENNWASAFSPVSRQNEKVQIYSTLPDSDITLIMNDLRYTVRLVKRAGFGEFILVAVHLPSKINFTDAQQSVEAVVLNMNLANIEERFGIENTLIVGDFNMHPFDFGMVTHAGFNAVMTRKIARQGSRQVQFRKYPYFYNPMWGFLGDLNEKMPGTLYLPTDIHWHLYDQLLIRPGLLPNFDPDELEILKEDGKNRFIDENDRIVKTFSDHLPLKFSLNL